MATTYKGIDVSKWNGAIDFNEVKADGFQFAILRIGTGYGQKFNLDPKFKTYYKAAIDAGLHVGCYFYSYATTVERAKAEAKEVIQALKEYKFDFPIAFDVEDKSQSKLSKATLTAITKAFCEEVEKAGYYVIIYSSKSWLETKLDMTQLSRFDIWIAQWARKSTYKGNFGIWQYSDSGRINGISGNVDLDIAYKDYPALIKNAHLNGFTKAAEKPANKPVEKQPVKKPTPKPAQKTEVKLVKGAKIVLNKKPVYSSAYTRVASGIRTGTFYLYDGEKINGRYRITTNKTFCDKKPTYQYVTGWVEL